MTCTNQNVHALTPHTLFDDASTVALPANHHDHTRGTPNFFDTLPDIIDRIQPELSIRVFPDRETLNSRLSIETISDTARIRAGRLVTRSYNTGTNE